ncbi:MAG TPA: CidA/LrgA family protein [Candidatus Sulfotelmatobacter sp.]|nr:CidA/LrgA family protein [Candidatus Sulfotelmatobacter sp.]
MLAYITLLLGCQLAGEVLVRLSGLPIPGPVVGMVILFIGLVVRGRVPVEMEKVTGTLLRYLSLLFVPAGVGVVVHLKRLSDAILPVAGAVIVGTLITIAVTGVVMQRMNRKGAAE